MTAFDLLRIIALDEGRPCRRNDAGKDVKSDMTPAMKKAKEFLGVEKRERQDDEIKDITEAGRPEEADNKKSSFEGRNEVLAETPENAAKKPKLGDEPTEQSVERRGKIRGNLVESNAS